jgi:YNFM family putative membrane transporter
MPSRVDTWMPGEVGAPMVARVGGVRIIAIGTLAFPTVVDLFATQAILPVLAKTYGVDAAAIAVAVNACTFGMAVAGLTVAYFGRGLVHHRGAAAALAALALPTALLALVPNLAVFAALRILQGLLMATAFTLTLSYLSRTSSLGTATAFAAYVTGNVASNIFGRLMSASIADTLGVQATFVVFAVLNLAGAWLAYALLQPAAPINADDGSEQSTSQFLSTLENRQLRAAFGIGFCILFAFIGTFTFVNFVLVRPPLSLGMMSIGFVYFVFLPSIVTTPMTGALARRFGIRRALWGGLTIAMSGLPMLLANGLAPVLLGLTCVGIGTFLAQATATGFVGRATTGHATTASGIYLASYFLGGLVGSAVLGQLFVRFGWPTCVAGVAVSLGIAAALTRHLSLPDE